MNALGELALRFAVPPDVGARRALAAALQEAPSVVDAVLAEHEGLVTFADEDARARVVLEVEAARARAASVEVPPVLHHVRVVYDGEDLDEVARQTGLGRARVVDLHASASYEVAMLGFLPGFAYLRGLPEALVLPRRASPRPRVPAGALAMAADYTGFYPFPSPGGWHLLGRALALDAFSPARGARFALGDRVTLEPAEPDAMSAADDTRARAPTEPAAPALEVRRALGPALVVDLGRPGLMHAGVPPGGPLVPEAFVLANLALANPAGAPGVEVFGTLELVARDATRVADASGAVHVLRAGDAVVLSPGRGARVTYVAVEGGLDVPRVLGGAGTLLVAGLGGHEGRPLRRGDVLGRAAAPATRNAPRWCVPAPIATRAEGPIVLLPGPDADAATLDALARGTFRVALASDRTGTRLDGPLPPLAGAARRPSTPMVEGVIERTPEGLVVLGPDHPTTGGYPVVAVVTAASRGALFARPLGTEVSFRLAAP